ncbi:LysR family transcriptional regulator [Variovorax sp. WS11]|uniref:LysR family transcriptional regulator n=1 Tax=Variovorax sp. WS11 TaxID=1105204 RepID=UPI000D0CF2E2|nr:LysR substrate-binding domain-containing protein [Variovorax sp. WS11]NDZ17297.1 LysR family transcriptional regulator [Variovorax sp. WS11]PSL80553.1 LysR family transcriptional regulator [Variovorax sp. WS11]
MDIRHLRYFVKVVELRNITAAAEALFIAQPSLSQHMSNLESELGVSLLERSVHGTRATTMGELLYRHAKTILRQFDDAHSAIRRESEAPSGRVAIGFPTSTSRIVAAPLLACLQERYPLIELELVEASSGDLVAQVAQDRLALAVTMNARADARLRIEPVLEEELFAVLAPAHRTPRTLSVTALAALPLLLPTHPNSVRVATERLFNERHLSFRLVAETSAVEILVLAVERGLGATVLPTAAFALAQHHGRVRGVPIAERPLVRELSLSLSVSAARSPAVQSVREMLLRVIEDEVAQGRWQGVRLLSAAEPPRERPARRAVPKPRSGEDRPARSAPRRPAG